MQLPTSGSLEPGDVIEHAGIGLAVGAVAGVLHHWLPADIAPWVVAGLLSANAAFFIGREAVQRVEKAQPMSRLWTSAQVLLEWTAPSLAAPAAWAAVHYLLPDGVVV